MDKLVLILTILGALGSGLIAGLFFIFSNTIMRALDRLPANEGMAAMQSINLVILNPVFLSVFLGTGLLSAVIAVLSIARIAQPGSGYIIAGAVIYIVGSLLVTMVFNVPMNNALAAADPASEAGQEIWRNYLTNWTFWNHIRTVASIASSFFFIYSLSAAR